jgi:hypothetical protein
MCDKAREILGGTREAAKNYVMGGKDRVMSWSNGVSQRLKQKCPAPAPQEGLRVASGVYSFTRVIVEIQFGSHVFPPSAENDCSNRAEFGVMSDHT